MYVHASCVHLCVIVFVCTCIYVCIRIPGVCMYMHVRTHMFVCMCRNTSTYGVHQHYIFPCTDARFSSNSFFSFFKAEFSLIIMATLIGRPRMRNSTCDNNKVKPCFQFNIISFQLSKMTISCLFNIRKLISLQFL